MDLPSSSPLSDYSIPLKGDDEEPGPSPTDVVAHPFPAFDHGTAVIQPFDGEAKRDDEFQQSTVIHPANLAFLITVLHRAQHHDPRTDARISCMVVRATYQRGRACCGHVGERDKRDN